MAAQLQRKHWFSGVKNRYDGFVNAFTGRGTSRDRNTRTSFQPNLLFTDRGNLNIYNGSGMGKRVIDRWSSDATREWISINNDEESEITTIMDLLDTQATFKTTLKWALATGGGVILMGIDDGSEELIEPLNENNIQKIHYLKAYNKAELTKDDTDIDADPSSPRFQQQEFYNIHPSSGPNQGSFKVHHSRILEFEGVTTDDETFSANGNFHLSMFQTLLPRLDGLDSAYSTAQEAMENYVLDVLHMQGLFAHFQGGTQSEVTERLDMHDMSKASRNTTAIDVDANEKLERLGVNLNGLPELVTKLENGVASVGGIPSIILYGQNGATGLNTNNDNEVRLYYDDVSSMQNEKLLKNLWRLCLLIQLSKDGPTGGVVDPEKTIEFNSLWQETAKEKADNYKTTADGDGIYIDRDVLTPDEVAQSRFVDNPDITLEDDHFEQSDEPEEDEDES